jgi:hypothetical protein
VGAQLRFFRGVDDASEALRWFCFCRWSTHKSVFSVRRDRVTRQSIAKSVHSRHAAKWLLRALCVSPGVLHARLCTASLQLCPSPGIVGDNYWLLFLYDAVVFLGALGYIMLPFAWEQTMFSNEKAPVSPAYKVAVWRVDAPPPSRSASRLRNVRRCRHGSGPPPSRQDVPDGAGLSSSWLMG